MGKINRRLDIDHDKVISMYVDNKKSTTYIANIFKCSHTTISNILKKQKIKLRSNKESINLPDIKRIKSEKMKCAWQLPKNKGRMSGEKNISKRSDVRIKLSENNASKIPEVKIKRSIAWSGKNNPQWGKPANPNAGRGTRSEAIDSIGRNVILRSNYEKRFVDECNKRDYRWIYEVPIKMKNRIWHPDFAMFDFNMYIDTKGYMDDYSAIKIKEFISEFPNIQLKIFFDEDIRKFSSGCSIFDVGIDAKILFN